MAQRTDSEIRLLIRKEAFESKGLKINLRKSEVMVSEAITKSGFLKILRSKFSHMGLQLEINDQLSFCV